MSQVVDYQKQFKSCETRLSTELMDFLQEWLVNHIKGDDKKYIPFLQE